MPLHVVSLNMQCKGVQGWTQGLYKGWKEGSEHGERIRRLEDRRLEEERKEGRKGKILVVFDRVHVVIFPMIWHLN